MGYFGSAAGASIKLSGCYAAGGVVTEAIAENYSGGLLGYLVASASGVSIENCYTSSNVYGKSTANTAYLGGFSSVAGSSSNADFSLDNSYCVGSVVDTGSRDSESGRFVADAQADVQGGILTSGCYVLADSLLAGKTFSSSETALVKELTSEKAADLASYFGYSEKIWKNGTAPYTYPVLIATPSSAPHVTAFFYEENTVFHAEDVSFGGTAAAFTETPDSHYVFSHWSLIPNGEAVKLADTRLLCDTLFFANFTNEYRSYKIDFMTDGKLLQTDTLIYGSPIVFPQAPEKESDQAFRYVFTHWSDSENGPDNVKNATVSGDMVFYAVYARIETGVWDGKTADAFVKGSGTKDDPFSILTPANLYFLSQNVGTDAYNTAYYVLESDIDLGGHEWTPIGNAETPFRGHFDGAGYSVNNFQITREQAYVGVFGLIENGIVSKLAVSNFTVNMQAADTEAVYERIGNYDVDYRESTNATSGSYFSDALYEQMKDDLVNIAGYSEANAEKVLTAGGLRIYSTLDPMIQKIADEEFANAENYPSQVNWYLNYALTVVTADGTKNNYSKENMMTWFKQNVNKNFNLIFSSQEAAYEAVDTYRAAVLDELGIDNVEDNYEEAV